MVNINLTRKEIDWIIKGIKIDEEFFNLSEFTKNIQRKLENEINSLETDVVSKEVSNTKSNVGGILSPDTIQNNKKQIEWEKPDYENEWGRVSKEEIDELCLSGYDSGDIRIEKRPWGKRIIYHVFRLEKVGELIKGDDE